MSMSSTSLDTVCQAKVRLSVGIFVIFVSTLLHSERLSLNLLLNLCRFAEHGWNCGLLWFLEVLCEIFFIALFSFLVVLWNGIHTQRVLHAADPLILSPCEEGGPSYRNYALLFLFCASSFRFVNGRRGVRSVRKPSWISLEVRTVGVERIVWRLSSCCWPEWKTSYDQRSCSVCLSGGTWNGVPGLQKGNSKTYKHSNLILFFKSYSGCWLNRDL